jgi:hypothetical protein
LLNYKKRGEAMTLNKIHNFAQTRDAERFAAAIEARIEGAQHLMPKAPKAFAAPAAKALSVA